MRFLFQSKTENFDCLLPIHHNLQRVGNEFMFMQRKLLKCLHLMIVKVMLRIYELKFVILLKLLFNILTIFFKGIMKS